MTTRPSRSRVVVGARYAGSGRLRQMRSRRVYGFGGALSKRLALSRRLWHCEAHVSGEPIGIAEASTRLVVHLLQLLVLLVLLVEVLRLGWFIERTAGDFVLGRWRRH